MKYDRIEDMLASIIKLLNHIDDTQKDILDLSERTVMTFHAYMEKNHLLHDTETLKAFQYARHNGTANQCNMWDDTKNIKQCLIYKKGEGKGS